MIAPSTALAAWWSIVDVAPSTLTVVVVIFALVALGFVGLRAWQRRR